MSLDDNLETDLSELPDRIADALEKWRLATFNKKRKEALLYAEYRGLAPDMSATEIKFRICSNSEIYDLTLAEIRAEVEHTRLLEKHLANKKRAGFRNAS